MKTILPFLFCLATFTFFGQDFNETLNEIREAESKSALSQMMQRANLNTGNYDVTYHKLEFTIDPSSTLLNGVVTTNFIAKENMTEVTFDLADNMVVSQVMQNGNSLSFTQNTDDELVITLFETLDLGETGIVEITYSGNPISSGFGSYEQTTHNGDPIIWTLSEPYGAKGWWPCKQDLNDKVDNIDVYITTPQFNPSNEEYIAVSNGLEQSQTVNGSNKTTHFSHQYPIPAYLIAIAVTNYEVYSHTVPNNGNPFEIVNYVYPETLATAQSSTPITVDIMNIYTNLFEEYPFASEKYGHAQFGWGGGMEHTTVSFMGGFNRNLIAHELAHQWFGDKITCGSWKDIWLNEGFATYLSGIIIDELDGNDAFRTWKQQRTSSITSAPDGAVYLSDTDTLSVNRIFSSRLSYNKGSMVLHMLRKKIGDVNFFQGLQDYLNDTDHAFAYAKTEDFIPIMEAASGEDLTEFFSDWLYNEGYPSYTILWNQPLSDQVNVNISQIQSDASVSFFEAQVPLRLIGTMGEELDITLDNTTNQEAFTIPVTFTVASVIFDPEADLISKNNSVSLSLEEPQVDQKLSIYPSPATHKLMFKKPSALEVSEVRIFNTLGQLLYQSIWQSSIDVSSFSSGVLFVQLQTNQGIINKSVLKN